MTSNPWFAQGAGGDGLGTSVMPVEARLGDDDAIGPLHECVTLRPGAPPPPTGARPLGRPCSAVRRPRPPVTPCRSIGARAVERQTVGRDRIELRTPLARAVAPVLAGLAFFVVLGLILWGVARSHRRQPGPGHQPRARAVRGGPGRDDRPGPSRRTGRSSSRARPGQHDRLIVLDHTGGDPLSAGGCTWGTGRP